MMLNLEENEENAMQHQDRYIAEGGDPDEESGSAYEESSTSEPENIWASSHDRGARQNTSRPGKEDQKMRGMKRKSPEDDPPADDSPAAPENDAAIRHLIEHVTEWASNFQAPDPEDIPDPIRHSRRRHYHVAPSQARANKLRRYYDNNYRKFLNDEIQDAAGRPVPPDDQLQPSQIGSSKWTSMEKTSFFHALSQLGRDNVRGIACRIGTKSELEVQHYIRLLQQALMEKKLRGGRQIAPTDILAASEISDECCIVLERAGDALSARQECHEESAEKARWGDIWLIDDDVSRQIDWRRRQDGGEEAMEEVFPAANLLNLSNMIELSQNIFMNPTAPREEDNWYELAEPGETPAIRATAAEDLHSLTVNFLKRLISTTLFCTMSRQRARPTNNIVHADISRDDVSAAIGILKAKHDSLHFWEGAARRNNVQVIDDESSYDNGTANATIEPKDAFMSHNEVENILRDTGHARSTSRSRSRSVNRPITFQLPSRSNPEPTTSPSDYDSEATESENSVYDSASEYADIREQSSELSDSPPPNSSHHSAFDIDKKPKALQARAELEAAQELFTEAFDLQLSRRDEIRLWALIDQSAPFEIEVKSEDVSDNEKPKGLSAIGAGVGTDLSEHWREWTEYRAEWEDGDVPVSEEHFENNGKKFRERRTNDVVDHGEQARMRHVDRDDETGTYNFLSTERIAADQHDEDEDGSNARDGLCPDIVERGQDMVEDVVGSEHSPSIYESLSSEQDVDLGSP